MKLLVHRCNEENLDDRVEWLSNISGLRIFEIHRSVIDKTINIIIVVLDKELRSLIKLRYSTGTLVDV